METSEGKVYRSILQQVESLQMELRRNYSVRRRQEAQAKLDEAMPKLEKARRDLIEARARLRRQAKGMG